jgi:integrase
MGSTVSVFLVRREGKRGVRWHVRYQAHKYSPQIHLGVFKTKRAAEARRDWAELEIASGRVPDRNRIEPRERVTMREAVGAYLASRVDHAETTRKREAQSLRLWVEDTSLGALEPNAITADDVQTWVSELLERPLAPGTVRLARGALAKVLDHARVEPNPARSTLVRLPRRRRSTKTLPTRRELEAIYARLSPRYEDVYRFLEASGLRIGELVALEWRDVDGERGRVLVRESKTGQPRFVTLDTLPARPDGATSTTRVFGGTEGATRMALVRVCHLLGIHPYTPHDFRHLHASRLLHSGSSPAEIAARLGHSVDELLKTYSHVVPPD